MTREIDESDVRRREAYFAFPGLNLKLCTFDRELRNGKTSLSAGFAKLLGLGETALDLTFEEALARVHPEDVERVRAAIMNHLGGRTPQYEDQYRVRHQDGSYLWVLSQGQRQPDPDGAGYIMFCTVIDITEHRRRDERERAQRRLSESIARIQSNFLAQSDPRTTFDDLLSHLLALTASEFGFIGEVLHDDDQAPYLKTYAITDIAWNEHARAMYKAKAPNLEFRDLGSLFGAVLTTRKPVIANDPGKNPRLGGLPPGHPPLKAFLGLPFDNGEEIIGMVGIANRPGGYDDTVVAYLEPFLATCANFVAVIRHQEARHRAEVALKESEQRYRNLVELSPDAVFVNQDERVVFANRAAVAILGAHYPREILGLCARDFILSPAKEADSIRSQRIMAEGWIPPFMEVQIRALDGSVKDVEITGARVMYSGKPAVQAVWRDISERKRALERELRSRRLESLGTLAGGVAHDFNNILAAVRVNLDMALEDPAASREKLEQIKLASDRAAALVQQILDFSRPGTDRRESVDLRTIVREALALMRPTIPAMIELDTRIADADALVNADAHQIHQIAINLLSNAVHAIGGRTGRIMTEVFTEEDPSTPFTWTCLRISDDGVGMDPHTRDRIFDPFFTTKEPGQGVGLGLSIVHEIIKLHGGRIEVKSSPGEGTTFEIHLPRCESKVAVTPSAPQHNVSAATRILFVDDDPLVNFAMERALKRAGYTVTAHQNPTRALSHWRAHSDQFDVLVLDMAMPEMNGLEFARAVRDERRTVPIVLTSGYLDVEDEAAARELGIAQIVMKPYDVRTLAAAADKAVSPPAREALSE